MAGTHSNAKVDPHQSWSLDRRMGRVKIFQSTLNNGTLPAPLGKCWTAVEQSSKVQQGMEKRMLDRSLAEQSSKVWKNWHCKGKKAAVFRCSVAETAEKVEK